MRKIVFISLVSIIGIILAWGCAEYAPAPEVRIIDYWPTVGIVYDDSIGDISNYSSLTLIMDTIKFEPVNKVDFVLDYLQVNYYTVDGTFLFTDNTLQPVNITFKAGDVSSEDGTITITQNTLVVVGWPINFLSGIKYMYDNNIKTLTAEIVFYGHAYYNEDKTFTTSMKIGLARY